MKVILWMLSTYILVEVGKSEKTEKNIKNDLKKDKRGTLRTSIDSISLTNPPLVVSTAPSIELNSVSPSSSYNTFQNSFGSQSFQNSGLNLNSLNSGDVSFSNSLPLDTRPLSTSSIGLSGLSSSSSSLPITSQSLSTSSLNINDLPSSSHSNINSDLGLLQSLTGGSISLTNLAQSSSLPQTSSLNNVGVPQQSVQIQQAPVQNNVRTIIQQVPVPVPQPYPVTITKQVAVPQPYPVHITRQVAVPVQVRVPVEVPRPYEVRIPHPVPVPVEIKVPVEVPKPYPVEITKTVQVPVEKQVFIRVPHPVQVPVPQPYPVPVPQPVRINVPHPIIIREPQLVQAPNTNVQINPTSQSFQINSGGLSNSESYSVGNSVNQYELNSNSLNYGSASNLRPNLHDSNNYVPSKNFNSYNEAQLASLLPPPPPQASSVSLEQSYVSSIQGGMYGLNKYNTADYQRTW